jgi:type IV pilus assembly protein PilY1
MTSSHRIGSHLCASLLLLVCAACPGPDPQPLPPPQPKPPQLVSRPANVHFLIDTSGSMRELPQVSQSDHRELFALTTEGCVNPRLDAHSFRLGWNPETSYPRPDLGTFLGADNGFPDLFRDDKFYAYMSWGTSNAPPHQWNSKDEACQSQVPDWNGTNAAEYSRCVSCLGTKGYYMLPGTVGENIPPFTSNDFILWGRFLNFNPPKYVTLRAVLKQTLDALGSPELGGMRVGLSTFTNTAPHSDMLHRLNPLCDQGSADPESFKPYRPSYINDVNAMRFETGTPLARALLNAGYFFTSGDEVYRDAFGFGSDYSYPVDFLNDALTSSKRSVCWGCQTSAVIVVTDGEPTNDSLPAAIVTQLRTLNGGPVYCPDSKPCGPSGLAHLRDKGSNPDVFTDDNPNYMFDDVAKLLANQDLQRATPPVVGAFDTAGPQHLRTYAIGFGVDSPLLEHAASVGSGLYSTASSASELKQALERALLDVKTHARTCTATE